MGVLMVCKSTSNTRVSLWFANRPVIPAICKASNKKAPCSSMHKMLKYAYIQILLMDFLLTSSAHSTKDSYFMFLTGLY